MKRRILIKNKRLSSEVEKKELELFRKGELKEEDIEDDSDPKLGGASASPIAAAIAGSASTAPRY